MQNELVAMGSNSFANKRPERTMSRARLNLIAQASCNAMRYAQHSPTFAPIIHMIYRFHMQLKHRMLWAATIFR